MVLPLCAQVTTPSLRVGYEIAYAESQAKPILCLFNPTDIVYEGRQVSPFLRGNERLQICSVRTARWTVWAAEYRVRGSSAGNTSDTSD